MCEYSSKGAVGFIINKATKIDINAVLKQCNVDPLPTAKPTLWGGPVGEGAVFVLFQGELPDNEGWTLNSPSNPISIGVSISLIEKLLKEESPFEIVLGYSGWSPKQLDQEIQSGTWLYSDLDPSILLAMPSQSRYDFALESLGLQKERIWMNPIDE